ncbi:MAG TPA: 2-amino-4-hydroxy-6-hydroxymethyldihydropteridine diphosphokinase [Vicinamibacterales bacterium]|nr:2-amino-4-hydroxy-6-hydroxymethyldihydropteridine diphosphokinase [Vicinamibacterales bacterium]HOG29944.1 2-amino-4-hydroxy-6-hydroxymethyldihydropteridine diphosphokinase [Vicinamibacterales bacterium]HOQ60567.1 2-amino-4-hydroxy-6-hydroxymethyldihydropteridine diphosphokinase [Vicinamibacterales bacterium]HPK71757.1 2-amino-4-hydroxy-6-hydroxymethyldihydropteridine diphosphokinase [Vicinamibacterales bacterium]HPW20849.1 2-amino-4-hydroxy-6-hydroxymethyldihydropteridine diphosphokinase [V
MPVHAAVALGSNLGDRLAALDGASRALARLLDGVVISRFIETAAEGVGEQPPFLNGAAVGLWGGGARALLEALLAIERDAGRERPYSGAPRILDLDLILFGSAVIDEPGLAVPHPRFRERGFVLGPLSEIAPNLVDPVTGATVAALHRAWLAQSARRGGPDPLPGPAIRLPGSGEPALSARMTVCEPRPPAGGGRISEA